MALENSQIAAAIAALDTDSSKYASETITVADNGNVSVNFVPSRGLKSGEVFTMDKDAAGNIIVRNIGKTGKRLRPHLVGTVAGSIRFLPTATLCDTHNTGLGLTNITNLAGLNAAIGTRTQIVASAETYAITVPGMDPFDVPVLAWA